MSLFFFFWKCSPAAGKGLPLRVSYVLRCWLRGRVFPLSHFSLVGGVGCVGGSFPSPCLSCWRCWLRRRVFLLSCVSLVGGVGCVGGSFPSPLSLLLEVLAAWEGLSPLPYLSCWMCWLRERVFLLSRVSLVGCVGCVRGSFSSPVSLLLDVLAT